MTSLSGAGLMLIHGISKLLNGLDPVEGMLAKAGFPAFSAYGALLGEVVAPLLVLANVMVAPAALVMALNMLVQWHWRTPPNSSHWARPAAGHLNCRASTFSAHWPSP